MGTEKTILIVGQGIAGTVLAWRLIERGARVLVVERGDESPASRVAAGIMTPITGQRMVKTWRIDDLWPCARAFYQRMATKLGARFFHEMPIARIFESRAEAALWEKRWPDPAYADYTGGNLDPAAIGDSVRGKARDHGGFAMKNCGWVDVVRFLDASRRSFKSDGRFVLAGFDESEVATAGPGPLRWKGLTMDTIVFCTGFAASASRLFDWVPFKAAKGEILDIEIDGFDSETRILNRGNWLLPLGGGAFRTGTTYDWTRLDSVPTESARAEIEANLRGLIDRPYRVTAHKAAVRPIIRESKVLLGLHPAYPQLGFFNGLGSKGVLNAPFFADQFAAHLMHGEPIDEEVDLRKNF